ncbi:hypothetical protein DL96DRAFT_1418695, partial [Flagelloscypha sp. PMI_526]
KTPIDFTKAMRGRCYGCGNESHVKAQCPKKTIRCSYCKRVGHLEGVCRDRFLGYSRDRGLQA